MEVVQQQFLAFILFTWQLINFRMQALFDESLEAERTRTRAAEKNKIFLELIQDATDKSRLLTRQRRRRIRMLQQLHIHSRRPTVWSFSRASTWWESIVPEFTNRQWVDNFRMSEETFMYLCNKMRPALQRQDTNFRLCLTLASCRSEN
ncbi:unnamed protein product [Gadus morhua 'NCC']